MTSYAFIREVAKTAQSEALICVLAAQCTLPEPYKKLDVIDLSTWDGSLIDPAFQRVLKRIGALIDHDVAREARLRARGEQADVVAVLRTSLIERVLAGGEPMTRAQTLNALAKGVEAIGVDDVADPLLSGALAELTEQNRRRREPPLGALVGEFDVFRGHSIMWGADRRAAAELGEDCLFRIREHDWFLNEC
jgi:hypothetical protein